MSQDFFAGLSLRDVVQSFNLRADKSLGQHFLLDKDVLQQIASAAGPLDGLNVVEVGPGPGGLTRALLNSEANQVFAIEFDPRAIAAIKPLAAAAIGRLHVIHGDALKLDIPVVVPPPRVIIANLPYNIGSALLVNWLREASAFESMTLMFQKEVAERICAPPNTTGYGRLSVLAQWLCDVTIVMYLPASAFSPPPKVESALVRLVPKKHQPDRYKFDAMGRLTAAAFGQRRKMLRGALRALNGAAVLAAVGINPERRAETLSIVEFEQIMLELTKTAATRA